MSTTKQTIDAYNQFSTQYSQQVASDSNFWNKCIEVPAMESLVSGKVKNKVALDLGCGSGLFTVKLSNWGAKPRGVDVAEEMIKIARSNFSNLSFDVGDAEKLQYADDSFDVITSSLALHYIQNLQNVFKEAARVLKLEGKIYFSMHHPLFKNHKTVDVNGQKEKVLKPYFNNDQVEWGMFEGKMLVHTYHHTLEDIAKALNTSGFVINQILEPKPIPSSKDINPKDFETASNFPTFIVVEATLTNK